MSTRALLVAVATILIACGSGPSGGTTTPTSATSAPSTTAPVPVYKVDNPTLAPPSPLEGSAGASGSGCPPGGGPPEDGVWYGYVTASSDSSITFEFGCLYFGDVAWEEAAKDGTEAPNDVYIRTSDRTWEVAVADGATAYTIVAPPNSELRIEAVSYPDWPQDPSGYTPCPGESCSAWIYVNDGIATEILEQYLP